MATRRPRDAGRGGDQTNVLVEDALEVVSVDDQEPADRFRAGWFDPAPAKAVCLRSALGVPDRRDLGRIGWIVHPCHVTGRELVARHPEEWWAATHHPFLDGVRDGSLPEAAFRTWLVQDYLFVLDLLRFQGRLVSVAPRAGQRVVGGGLVALEAELGWFESQAARLRLRLDLERHPVTEVYRRRLLSYADDWARGITAIWTGERAYLESWSGVAPGAPAYREFVEHWAHPDFDAYVRELERLVDAAGPDEEAFVTVCGLERHFWEMAWSSARG